MGNRRIWWGLGIMAAGLCAAWPFRKSWLAEQEQIVHVALSRPAAVPTTPPPLFRQQQPEPNEPSPALDSPSPRLDLHPLTSALERGFTQRSIVRVEERPLIPMLASDFSTSPAIIQLDPRAAVLGHGDSPMPMAGEPPPPKNQRRYRILKHDTLESIAERLLGSREHAEKLLAANTDVILAPEVLPVGATIVIPDASLPPATMVRVPDGMQPHSRERRGP